MTTTLTEDDIAQIRARQYSAFLGFPGADAKIVLDDMARLLAEVDRLRAAERFRAEAIAEQAAAGWTNEQLPLVIGYTNWRGEWSERRIVPTSAPYWGSTEWHPEPGWLLPAIDVDKGEPRVFAMKDFGPAHATPPEAAQQWRELGEYRKRYEAAEAEIERLRAAEKDVDESEQAPWPEWAEEIRARLERMGRDFLPGEEINLGGEFNEWADGVEQAEARLHARLKAAEAERDEARARAERAKVVLLAYQEWEAAIIQDLDCWLREGMTVDRHHYDRMIEIQAMRNVVLEMMP